ncbi:MAG: cation transporter [Chitinophagaceae bacterium]|nr:cation transporter [Chitinophagaceae bacterium]
MKKVLFLIALIGGFAWSANAQLQPKKPVTVKISTPTVQCEQCKKKIENYMKGEEGISKINVDFKRKITTITYLPERTNIENVKTGIANAGYDADDVKANEDSYKALPTCCKKPADQK